MIRFGLKRKLWNRKYLMKLVIVFACIGFVVNVDILYKSMTNKVLIKLDESVGEYIQYFKDTDTIQFVSDADIRLVYEDKWIVYTSYDVSHEVLEDIEEQIGKIPEFNRNMNFEVSVYHSRTKDESLEFIVYTVLYFLFMSKSIIIVQEIIEDKVCGMQKLFLTSISCKEYIRSKIFEGWLQVVIENVIMVLFGVIWIFIRFGMYRNNGFKPWLESWLILDSAYFRFDIVLIGIVLLMVGLFIMQYIIVVYMCKAKTIEEASHMTVWIHILPIVIYYFCYSFYKESVSKCLLLLPFLQTLLLPMSLSFEGEITPFIGVGVVFLAINVVFMIVFKDKRVKKRMLNI